VPPLFRDPVLVTFIDPDNAVLTEISVADIIPRAGENVRIAGVPYVVERVGYDLPVDAGEPAKNITRVFVVCRRA
jgi:hypothetical protein